jgi:hypothetical protein
MKFLIFAAGISCALLFGNNARADLIDFSTVTALNNCTQITKQVGVKTSGRFGWKPTAAHFNSVVIVGPRLYNLPPDKFGSPTAKVISATTGKTLFTARLKSHSVCNGAGEDLCADTWITPIGFNGRKIENKYGPVVVALRPPVRSTRGCRFYFVPHPSKRVQYVNR